MLGQTVSADGSYGNTTNATLPCRVTHWSGLGGDCPFPPQEKKDGPAKVVWVERVGLELGEMKAGPGEIMHHPGTPRKKNYQKTLYVFPGMAR